MILASRLLRSRRGDWIQLLMIFFFLLTLILSVALLALDQGKLKSERSEFGTDMADQEANAQLINILRVQATGGFEGGRRAQLADLIIINNGTYDDMILNTLEERMPPTYYYEITISYPDGKAYRAGNTKYEGEYRLLITEKGPLAVAQELANKAFTQEWRSRKVPTSLATTFLPGVAGQNIKIELFLSRKVGDDDAELWGERT